jgi:hypothetical protein
MELLKKIYIYIFSAVGLVLVIIGSVELINLGLRAYVFTQADITHEYLISQPMLSTEKSIQPDETQRIAYEKETRTSTRQRQAANAVALLIVGVPLFVYHWRIIRKER